jgi:hypothetical protein
LSSKNETYSGRKSVPAKEMVFSDKGDTSRETENQSGLDMDKEVELETIELEDHAENQRDISWRWNRLSTPAL